MFLPGTERTVQITAKGGQYCSVPGKMTHRHSEPRVVSFRL